jgi:AsmA protein
MKKILIVLGTLVFLALAAIIVVPMVVDVDQYRPQILQAANAKLNGKLELGHLKLTMWGSIRVEIDGLSISDAKGAKLVAVKDAFVVIPWTSIFGGSPLLTFNMNDPEIHVVKDSSGKLNVMSLMKESASGGNAAVGGNTASNNDGASLKLPAIATNARLGIDIRNALFAYKDEVAKSETAMKNLNFRVRDLSLSRTTEVEISGLFQSSEGSLFKIAGPFTVALHASPHVEGGEFRGLTADMNANFDDLEIQAAQAFYKKKGVVTQVVGALDISKDQVTISKLSAKFFNAEIDMSGKIVNLQTDPNVDFTVKSNTISLAPWNELIPMLKDYSLEGSASFEARANGSASKIQYAADLAVKDLKAKSPMLKAEPVVNISVKVVTDKIERLLATVKAPGNDLTIDGSVTSFVAPKIDLKVTSSSLDLDQLVNLPPADKASAKSAEDAKVANGGKAPEENLDAMLDPLRKNEIARATTLVTAVNMKLVQFEGVKMTDILAKLSMRDLTFSVDSFAMKLWDGTIGMKAKAALLPKTPTYSFSATIANLDLQKAVSSQMQMMKNTLLGKTNLKIEGSGTSFNTEAAKKNLNAKGSLKVTDAEFAAIDVAKMASEAINKALDKVGDKIPAAKGKSIKSLPEGSSKYEFIASDFTIAGGHFSAPNFNAKAQKNQGLDLRGTTDVGLIDQELKAEWEIIDTYNLTKARDVGFDVSGVHVPSALAEGSNPVVIPISVACKYTAPCPSYGKVPEHFLKVAFDNTKKGALGAVKAKAVDQAKDTGKKLLKGLFGH